MMSRAILLSVLLLLMPLAVPAAEPDARIVNAYFCNDAVEVDGWLQPVRVITQLKGNHPAAAALFVLNVALQPGRHELVGGVFGPDGKLFTQLEFKPEQVSEGESVRAMWGVLKNRLPTGGITVKVFHRKDGGKRRELGEFYLPTVP